MKKKFLALALVLVMLFAMLAGCSNNETDQPGNSDNPSSGSQGNQPSGSQGEKPSDSGNNVVGGDAEQTDYVRPELNFDLGQFNIDPTNMMGGNQVTYSVYEMLYTTENGIGTPMTPWLADATRGGNNSMGLKGMDHEDGSTDYTFYIYDYITHSAGNKITASDVVFSFKTTLAAGRVSGWGKIVDWEAIDDTTVVMHCNAEFTQKGEIDNIILRCYIFSEKAYNASQSKFTTDACGTGPYVITAYAQDASITCEARADYWQTNEELRPRCAEANVAKFTAHAISDNNTKVAALEAGDIDMIASISATMVADFVDGGSYGDKFDVYTYPANGINYVSLNVSEHSIMSDPNMRLAIYYAINNEGLAAVLNAMGSITTYYPLTGPGHALFGDYVTAWDSQTTYVTEYNLEKSKQYAEAAGYNGEEIVFLCADATGIVESVQNMLVDAGFNIKISQWDRNAVNGYLSDPTAWDMYANATNSSDYVTSLWSHIYQITSNEVGTENFIDDDHFDELLVKALTVGSSEDDMDAFWQYCVENAYFYPTVRTVNCIVYPEGGISSIWRNDKNTFIPGAAYYVEG